MESFCQAGERVEQRDPIRLVAASAITETDRRGKAQLFRSTQHFRGPFPLIVGPFPRTTESYMAAQQIDSVGPDRRFDSKRLRYPVCLVTDSEEPSGVGEHMLALAAILSRYISLFLLCY